jgi:hypothetical protein
MPAKNSAARLACTEGRHGIGHVIVRGPLAVDRTQLTLLDFVAVN